MDPAETKVAENRKTPDADSEGAAPLRTERVLWRRAKGFFLPGLLGLSGFALTLYICLIHYVYTPAGGAGAEEIYIIRPGAGFDTVTRELESKGLIPKAFPVRVWAAVKGYDGRIQAGEYRLNRGWSPARIVEGFVQGAVVQHTITIPEGYNIGQIAELLQARGVADMSGFLALAEDPAVVAEYGLQGDTLEGYLYPDTYRFNRGTPPRLVLNTLVGRLREVLDPLREAIDASGMSLHQVLTLASIVEKETGAPEERPLIAGVFLNRLEKNMRLESDPTVIYGLEDFNGNLTRADLAEPHAFNTYVIPALPPGPIANPGLEAILAVLCPAKTPFLYFVSKNNGTHYFSRTFSEHARAVVRYQKAGRRSSGKTS